MRMRTILCVLVLALSTDSAIAQHDDHDHESDSDHPEWQPQFEHGRHLHFNHPLVTESPLPEDQVRFNFIYQRVEEDDDRADTYTAEAAVEFTLSPNVAIEISTPYTWIDADDGPSVDRLDNIEVALKLASFALADRGILLGAGLEVGLPTGSDRKGIGSSREIELEPYLALAWRRERFEMISLLRFGIPLNEPSESRDEVDLELGFDLSLQYFVARRVIAVLELNGTTIAAGDEDESTLRLSPGIIFIPPDERVRIGVGVGFPVAGDEPFEVEGRVMFLYHF